MPSRRYFPVKVPVSKTPLNQMTYAQLKENDAPRDWRYPIMFKGHAIKWISIEESTSLSELRKAAAAIHKNDPGFPNHFDKRIDKARKMEDAARDKRRGSALTTLVAFMHAGAFLYSSTKTGNMTEAAIGITCLGLSGLIGNLALRDSLDVFHREKKRIHLQDKKASYAIDVQNQITDLIIAREKELKDEPWHKPFDIKPDFE